MIAYDIISPYKVVIENVLANRFLFTHPVGHVSGHWSNIQYSLSLGKKLNPKLSHLGKSVNRPTQQLVAHFVCGLVLGR